MVDPLVWTESTAQCDRREAALSRVMHKYRASFTFSPSLLSRFHAFMHCFGGPSCYLFFLWYPETDSWFNACNSTMDVYRTCYHDHKYQRKFQVLDQRALVREDDKGEAHSTTYSSALTTASDENTTSSPFTLVTLATPIPGKLPCATNPTLTGKNTPTSSPPTVNSSVPDRSSVSAEIRGIDQSSACVDGLKDQRDAPPSDTVGYEPVGRGMVMVTSYSVMWSCSSSYSMLTSHLPSLDGDGQQLTVCRREIEKKQREGVSKAARSREKQRLT